MNSSFTRKHTLAPFVSLFPSAVVLPVSLEEGSFTGQCLVMKKLEIVVCDWSLADEPLRDWFLAADCVEQRSFPRFNFLILNNLFPALFLPQDSKSTRKTGESGYFWQVASGLAVMQISIMAALRRKFPLWMYKFMMLFLDSFSMSSQKAHQGPSPPSVEQILEDLAAARDDDVVFKSSIVAGESAQISKGKGNKLASHSGELISGVYWYLITLSYVDNVAKLIIEMLSQESVFYYQQQHINP